MRLLGKTAIITGGGRGIGRTIARRFAAEGAAVALSARTEREVRETAAEIEASGAKAMAEVADVSREEDCERIVSRARKAFGAVHILINNAAIYGPVRAAEKITQQEWDEVMAVNLRGPFLMCRLVLPEMYRQGSGAIVNITSVAGKAAFGLGSPYAASKAGLAGFTRSLAAEAARKGVRVNALSPGPVTETKMSKDLGRNLADYLQTDGEALLNGLLQGILQGRPQTAEEIAAAAVFLASDESSAITGQTLNVDGGMVFY